MRLVRKAWLMWAALGAGAALALALVGAVDPRAAHFFPRCLVHVATGLHCPGCGSTRATHSLLHGRVADAWSMNPLFILAVPLIALLLWSERFSAKPLGKRPWLPWMVLATVVIFWVARNLPGPFFQQLAPH